MTSKAYALALRQLESGTLTDRKVGDLAGAAAERLADYPAKVANDCATAITAFWHQEIARHEWEREAIRIADAAARFRRVVEDAERWRDYLRLPDEGLWGMAHARTAASIQNTTSAIRLATYLRVLETHLREALPPGGYRLWGPYGNPTGRKADLTSFVIRYVDGLTPASGRDSGTRAQQRFGRNTFIATICTALLARPITRQMVAQTLKKAV